MKIIYTNMQNKRFELHTTSDLEKIPGGKKEELLIQEEKIAQEDEQPSDFIDF